MFNKYGIINNQTYDYNYTLSKLDFSMEFTRLRNNGSALITFSEDMIDQNNGFNVTMLYKEGLMILNISLTYGLIFLIGMKF